MKRLFHRIRLALYALVPIMLYHLALSAGIVSRQRSGDVPLALWLSWIATEFAASCLVSFSCVCGGRRLTPLYGVFFLLELAVALCSGIPVGMWEFVAIMLFALVYASVAAFIPYDNGFFKRCIGMVALVFTMWGAFQYAVYFAYMYRFGGRPSINAIASIFSTNFAEASAFLTDQFGFGYFVFGLLVFVCILYVVLRLSRLVEVTRSCRLRALLFVVALAAALVARKRADSYSNLFFDIRYSLRYLNAAHELSRLSMADMSAKMRPLHAHKQGVGEVCLVVIGESANREHMQAWGYDRATTPWLASAQNVVIFTSPYSSMTSTQETVTLSISSFNNYRPSAAKKNKMFAQITRSVSLIDMLRAVGVRTGWISNQSRIGVYDNNITKYLAERADFSIFLHDSNVAAPIGISPHFALSHVDGDLLSIIEDNLKFGPGDKGLVLFVHLRGSHWKYLYDVPPQWPWLEPVPRVSAMQLKARERVESYDRSLHYTDEILRQIVQSLERSGISVASLIYYSDHGESVIDGKSHNYDLFVPAMTKIPLFFWYSSGYAARYPQTIANLRANKDKVFTNDLIFELAVGVNHISFKGLDQRYQLTSPNYAVTAESARFWEGRRLIDLIPDLSCE